MVQNSNDAAPKPFTPGKIDVTASGLPTWGNDPRWATLPEGAVIWVKGVAVFQLTNGKWEKMPDTPQHEGEG